MKFIKASPRKASQTVYKTLQSALKADRQVLWLVCGGSNIDSEVEIMARLREETSLPLANLMILPMDERYGRPGHADSNYKIMTDKGFTPGTAHFVDILVNDLPLAETITRFGDLLTAAFSQADTVIGLFGMGADGHTAGIKPGSPAAADPDQAAAGYQAEDFTRLTLTPKMIRQVDATFLLAYGKNKRGTLTKLRDENIGLADMPAQIFRQVKQAEVYNDQVEGEAA